MTIVDGRVEDTFKPASHYAEVAVACRSMGMDIANQDYEKIETLLESDSVRTTPPSDAPTDLLLAGYLPHGATYRPALATRYSAPISPLAA
jgi:hypothetical protein